MASNSKKATPAGAGPKTGKKSHRRGARKGQSGQPKFVPTPEQRKYVESMSAYGIPQSKIAATLEPPIDEKTLRKHFPTEILSGAVKADAQVAQSLFRMATGNPAEYDANGNLVRAERDATPSAAIFWAKARLGMRETVAVANPQNPNTGKTEAFRVVALDRDQAKY